MPSRNVFRWIDGRGWLVFCGGDDGTGEVRAIALERASAGVSVAYIWVGSDAGEAVLDDMESLGGPTGYVVNVMTEDDETIERLVSEAGMVVIGGDAPLSEIRAGLMGAAVDGIHTAFENGAVILVEGPSISVFGAWMVLENDNIVDGVAVLENAVLLSDVTSAAASEEGRVALRAQPAAIAVGVGRGAALALGPEGEVETWGLQQVSVALGSHYTA